MTDSRFRQRLTDVKEAFPLVKLRVPVHEGPDGLFHDPSCFSSAARSVPVPEFILGCHDICAAWVTLDTPGLQIPLARTLEALEGTLSALATLKASIEMGVSSFDELLSLGDRINQRMHRSLLSRRAAPREAYQLWEASSLAYLEPSLAPLRARFMSSWGPEAFDLMTRMAFVDDTPPLGLFPALVPAWDSWLASARSTARVDARRFLVLEMDPTSYPSRDSTAPLLPFFESFEGFPLVPPVLVEALRHEGSWVLTVDATGVELSHGLLDTFWGLYEPDEPASLYNDPQVAFEAATHL